MNAISSQEEIEFFVTNMCNRIAVSKCGWFTLYLEDRSGDYWIKSYQNSSKHGGGQSVLKKAPLSLVKEQFDV